MLLTTTVHIHQIPKMYNDNYRLLSYSVVSMYYDLPDERKVGNHLLLLSFYPSQKFEFLDLAHHDKIEI